MQFNAMLLLQAQTESFTAEAKLRIAEIAGYLPWQRQDMLSPTLATVAQGCDVHLSYCDSGSALSALNILVCCFVFKQGIGIARSRI